MKTSIATVSISGTLPEKLSAIAAAGFDGVEIFEADFLTFDKTPEDVAAMARDHGLDITLFQPFRDFEGLPEPLRQAAFSRAQHKFDLMERLSTDLVLICSSVSPHALGGIDRAAADLRALGDIAAGRGLRIGYEALAWGRHVRDHRDAWEIVRRAEHPNVGLILDSFHSLSRDIPSDSIRAIPGDKIFFVQLADAPAMDMDLLHWSRHYRNMPGQGDLPVVDFMAAVAATGYSGPYSLEIFNDQFRGRAPQAVARDGHRALMFLADQVARAEPGVTPAPSLPDRVAVKGVAFIEFACNDAEAETLGALLLSLGFRRAGRHITKAVTLYRQGTINIVINTERSGLAHSAYLAHGISAYAFGLMVEDAAATVARAKALGAELFSQPIGPDEIDVPAIRGMGGSVLYFLDTVSELAEVWEREFVPPDDTTPQADAGLAGIDHVAQTMNYEEMLTWILFYRSILATRKLPMVDIPDPAGLVRSQVIENEDRSLRLTLNGAENHRTLAGHFVAETFGSGIQHVAFTSRDIRRTVRTLAGNGIRLLTVSPNYYDDLQARFDLDDDFTAELKALNLLYDRDGSGEFLQAYSEPFGEGFFFEIVERRGDYAGYGAPNAPFRIAAMKRFLRDKAMPRT
ncbi:bifunctional sugar phosphate isomerase/epimerase/4-hydroxyphenylpyruvate dioxygenase family protein [Pelagibacterium sediminicola]|uniref:bifunctional sugar phosphate isomerase/epimerase/4-hydroxyphenylpyruvate dioxygenase family protein n=1 Tax=Pelagibacterium sediminicola TaxID=2248761 RepID=UPI000E32230B|nr:sugar phosphate isomerase/epimerase and 4-hydroxyphenylpyruvate domain-containing protein [Pelagibacterium sediminicola]